MNALLDRGIDLGDDLRVSAIFAVRAGSPVAANGAVCQVFRGGDGEHAAQIRHLTENVGQRIAHPLAHGRMRSAEGHKPPLPHAGHFGPTLDLEKGRGHGPGLVHVKIHADAVFLGPLHNGPQVGQTLLVAGAELGKRRSARRQIAQNNVQPHAVDA